MKSRLLCGTVHFLKHCMGKFKIWTINSSMHVWSIRPVLFQPRHNNRQKDTCASGCNLEWMPNTRLNTVDKPCITCQGLNRASVPEFLGWARPRAWYEETLLHPRSYLKPLLILVLCGLHLFTHFQGGHCSCVQGLAGLGGCGYLWGSAEEDHLALWVIWCSSPAEITAMLMG